MKRKFGVLVMGGRNELLNMVNYTQRGRKGPLSIAWKGGRVNANGEGRIKIWTQNHPYATKGGYVMEHRLVMEKKLGRYLTPKEQVHHINGKIYDNRIENLKLFKNSASHTRHEWKTKPFLETRAKMSESAKNQKRDNLGKFI